MKETIFLISMKIEYDVTKREPILKCGTLIWMGVIGNSEEGYTIARYERATNRVFIKNEKGNYICAGTFLSCISFGNGKVLPITTRDESLHHEFSRFLDQNPLVFPEYHFSLYS